MRVWFETDATLPGVHAFCEARAFAKTGVEMEALSGVSGALLAVYDLVKQVDAALTIGTIRLEIKEGGKSGIWRHPEAKDRKEAIGERINKKIAGRAAVITASDRCFAGRTEDLSGKLLAEGLKRFGFKTSKPVIVPDEREKISAAVLRLAKGADVVILTGGTVLSPRDITPETVAGL